MSKRRELSEQDRQLNLGVAEIIRQTREKKGMSQQELATALECSLRHVRRMEGGEVNFRMHALIALCMALDLPSLSCFVPNEA